MHPRIKGVRVAGKFSLALDFTDGSHGIVDLAPWILPRGGVFEPLHDPAVFAEASVDTEAGTVVWPNGVDLDPDMLYEAAHAAPVGSDP